MTAAFVRQQGVTSVSNNGTHASVTYGSGGSAPVDGNVALFFGGSAKGSQVAWTDPAGSRYVSAQAQISDGSTSTSVEALAETRIISSDSGVTDQWTISPSANVLGAILEYSGIDTTNILDVTPVFSNGDSSSLAGITTSTDGCMVVYWALFNNATDTITVSAAPTGFTQRIQTPTTQASSSDVVLYVADLHQSSAGATGTVGPTFAGGTPTKIVSGLIALRPSGGSTSINTADNYTVTTSASIPGSSVAVTSTDTYTANDATSDLSIDDGVADFTFTDTAAVRYAAAVIDAFTFTDLSSVAIGAAATDTFTVTDLSSLTVLGSNPTTSDLFTVTDTGSLNSSVDVATTDGFTYADQALVVEVGFPGAGTATVTIVSPRGTVTISEGP